MNPSVVSILTADHAGELEALRAEVERLRASGPWVEHLERMHAMKRDRDGECICDGNPATTDGPQEFCPWHGRPYREVVEILESLAEERARLHSWDGLMSLLDEHYRESTFPTLPDDDARDPGPRIVSLIRHLDAARVENAELRREVNDLSGVQVRADELEAKLYAAHDELGSVRGELAQERAKTKRRGW